MASHQPSYPSYATPPASMSSDSRVSLPSIKELDFQYRPPSNHDGPPSNTSGQPADHGSISTHPRHEPSWARSAVPSSGGPPPQHSPHIPMSHESSKSHQYPSKNDGQYSTNGMPPPASNGSNAAGANGTGSGNSRGDAAQNALRRPRSGSSPSVQPGRSPHASYPQAGSYPQSQSSFGQGPPPQSHEPIHQPSPFSHPGPNFAYATYPPPPPHAARGSYPQHPSMHAQVPPNNSYPPPPPPEHWVHPPPSSQHVQPPYNNLTRTTPLVPANAELRGGGPTSHEMAATRQGIQSEILKLCEVLYQFASRYAQIQHNAPQAQPPQAEIQEMSVHASTVVKLLEDLRRLALTDDQISKEGASATNDESSRSRKRGWEEISEDDAHGLAPSYPETWQSNQIDDKLQTTAEQDMEIIRNKRATSANGTGPGQPKSKYRKRSRATPPGKCHSCNIRETPEWRRGPDGARTLCNACGLHYAKLMRKRDKNGGEKAQPPIDLQTLRASTANARGAESSASPHPPSAMHHGSGIPQSSYEHGKHQAMHHSAPHHTGSYQLMPINTGPPLTGASQPHHHMMPPPPPPPAHGEAGVVPPPPWMSSSSSRSYGPDHQSYMRASHTPSHARESPH